MKSDEQSKVVHSPQYKSLNVTVLYDERLSWKAKGILMYLLSKPKKWKAQIYDMQKWGTDGRKSIQSGLKELKDAGYVKYKIRYEDNKPCGSHYMIYDQVDLSKEKTGDILRILNEEF